MSTVLLLSLAIAGERPVLADDPACPVRSLKAGAVTTCDSIAMSLGKARWYAEIAEWGTAEHDRRALDLAVCAAEIEAAGEREAWWRDQATKPAVPTMAPWAVFGLGAGVGAVAVLVGALSVRWVSEVELTD